MGDVEQSALPAVAPSKLMSFAEAAAKRVLETVLRGTKLEFREKQSHGEYDFDLLYPDGTLAAVEVTRSIDALQMQTNAAIHSSKKEPVIPGKRCKSTWFVIPMPNANISAIREKVDGYLSALEEKGVKNFSAFEALNSKQLRDAGLLELFESEAIPPCVEELCDKLKIQAGSVISSEGTPKIVLGYPTYGGPVAASSAVKAAKAECWKRDNRKKLGAAKARERHLVTYVDALRGATWIALTEFEPPSALPELPPEIDHVWLVGDLGQRNEFVVWHATSTDMWQKFKTECV